MLQKTEAWVWLCSLVKAETLSWRFSVGECSHYVLHGVCSPGENFGQENQVSCQEVSPALLRLLLNIGSSPKNHSLKPTCGEMEENVLKGSDESSKLRVVNYSALKWRIQFEIWCFNEIPESELRELREEDPLECSKNTAGRQLCLPCCHRMTSCCSGGAQIVASSAPSGNDAFHGVGGRGWGWRAGRGRGVGSSVTRRAEISLHEKSASCAAFFNHRSN